MAKIDDLYTLVRLLKEFDLPVSPILEYAIKTKEDELIQAADDHSVIDLVPLDETEHDLPGISIEKTGLIISNTVRERRKEKEMSMDELAIKAGISRRTIFNLENGHRLPTFYVLSHVLDALGLVIGYVAQGSNDTSSLSDVIIEGTSITIGDVVRERRREKNLSMEALARKSGVSYRTIANIEMERNLPTLYVILKVLDAVDLEIRIVEQK